MEDSSPTQNKAIKKSNLIPSATNIDTNRSNSSNQKLFMERISLTDNVVSDENNQLRSAVKEDIGFKKYLRRVYLR